uniref:LIN1-like protein n=1 Tax=Anthurium amnicola TaxID=1678845 RepID=A0A1D1ZHE4_9ARAE
MCHQVKKGSGKTYYAGETTAPAAALKEEKKKKNREAGGRDTRAESWFTGLKKTHRHRPWRRRRRRRPGGSARRKGSSTSQGASPTSAPPPTDSDDDDDDEDPDKPSLERKVRFPKGKKAKRLNDTPAGGGGGNGDEDSRAFGRWMNPGLAAKERAKRRSQNRENDLFRDQVGVGGVEDIARAEVDYEVNDSFEDDGIQIEPFNLKQEREEGYFDTEGNYVEYVATNEIKDAWLDNVEVDPILAEKKNKVTADEEEYADLSTEDIGKIKRQIANALQPGETVLQALKRLKGTSGNKKDKMPDETKRTFDQLTEDAMKLMESGEYNVYYEKQETFQREAEGYERLAHARDGTSRSASNGRHEFMSGEDTFTDDVVGGHASLSVTGSLQADKTTAKVSSGEDDATFDMFGDEDENVTTNPHSGALSSQHLPESSGALQNLHPEKAGEGYETDYIFDESSGYYYSHGLGYYYDPASGLYCCAASGKWYSFNEQTGAYDEIVTDESHQTAQPFIRS